MAWYEQYLVQMISSLCQLVIRIEDGCRRSVADEGLVRRSINIIAVSMVNISTLDPSPPGARSLWNEVQKVYYRPLYHLAPF